MKINYLESLGAVKYQTPTIEMISISLEQPVMTESCKFGGNGPEGYDVDDDVFIW